MQSPETNKSLIVRLSDTQDADAWYQFTEVYRPIILRLGVARGLQRADAEDLAQKVLVSVAGAIHRWEPEGPAKFRTWLKRIIDNAVLNALTRTKPDRAHGSGGDSSLLNQQPERSGADSELLRIEYQREVFQWAARKVRGEFTDKTWQAFWLTAVESESASDVGRLLGRNRGSIYAARCRVMKRIMQVIEEFDERGDE